MDVQDIGLGLVVESAEECAAECDAEPDCNMAAYLTAALPDTGQVCFLVPHVCAVHLYREETVARYRSTPWWPSGLCIMQENKTQHLVQSLELLC